MNKNLQDKYSVVGMALGSANQAMRLEPGDELEYRNKIITVVLEDLEEFDTFNGLPEQLLAENGIRELIDTCTRLPATLLQTAQYRLNREYIRSAYLKLATYSENNPAIDRRLPAASVLFGHVFEYLLLHEFRDSAIAEILSDFGKIATRRYVIRQVATGVKTGEYDIELPGTALLRTDDWWSGYFGDAPRSTRRKFFARMGT